MSQVYNQIKSHLIERYHWFIYIYIYKQMHIHLHSEDNFNYKSLNGTLRVFFFLFVFHMHRVWKEISIFFLCQPTSPFLNVLVENKLWKGQFLSTMVVWLKWLKFDFQYQPGLKILYFPHMCTVILLLSNLIN